jgi:methyl-accepting chemotaxis protein
MRSVGLKLAAGFGLALLLLSVGGIAAWLSVSKLVETNGWVVHTHQVIEKAEHVLSLLDDAETAERGYLLTGDENFLKPYEVAKGTFEAEIQSLATMTQDNLDQQPRIKKLSTLAAEKLDLVGRIIAKYQEKGKQSADQGKQEAVGLLVSVSGKKLMDDIRDVIGQIEGEELKLLDKRNKEAKASADNTTLTIALGVPLSFLLLGLIAVAITRNIAKPLKVVTGIAEQVSAGDLSVDLPASRRGDEVGLLLRSFGRMTGSLREMAQTAERIAAGDLRTMVKPQSQRDQLGNAFAAMIHNLRKMSADITEGANMLGSSATEIATSTTQLATSAAETATSVAETTSTVSEVRQTAEVASQKARFVADNAQRMSDTSQTGKKATDEVIQGMNEIREQMRAIAQSMVRLSEQSQTIGQIITTVDDLAQQSNLLAVNASIEAAKAGEQGKGFAVVAQEVKSLADQSKQATAKVRAILSDIQKATSAAAMATEQGTKAVEAGVKRSVQAGDSIVSLTATVGEAAQAATQIAVSSQQQLVGMEQVAGAMESIKQASTQNVDSAKQLEAAAKNLSGLGSRLKDLVGRYKLQDGPAP